MFVVAEIKSLIRNKESRNKFIDLLNFLDIKTLENREFTNFDNFDYYQKLGDELQKKICEKLKSNDIFEGLENLLKISKIEYRDSETFRKLIEKICLNKKCVKEAVLRRNKI